MSDDAVQEPDRVPGAPHPRETTALLGQQAAEADFLDAFRSGRLHHGWLITGPRGVGKATLAWRIARFLLAQPVGDGGGLFNDPAPPADRLDIPADHPVSRRVAALSEPGLFLLRRGWDDKTKRLKQVITVDEARKLKGFFALSSAEGGRRVVIVDAADELNPSAANALLKLLEEPPARTTLLLVSHAPARLLPTIRSRCRELRCAPLSSDDLGQALANAGEEPGAATATLAELSGGSVGEALRLLHLGGPEIYAEMTTLLRDAPRLDRPRAIKLADGMAGREAAERFDVALRLADMLLARLARTGSGLPPMVEAVPGEAELMARLAPSPAAGRDWADLQQSLGARVRHGRAVNLDPASLILDMVLRINETAARMAAS
ncbi:DNA polymerase III subunit delta' [Tranquillimonas alkanivorans]|uniref:DNA polymerase III, delta prime subunit n=1 Tax=Tranquillimonas alkanivorans TaxID=441119 RepID=A0A1I5S9G6_9RHOB|nr:DNA polymerase III subunit delta' [Tranquillimonas alkanivorans]SFP67394.1 DNA polymerase III, delta prime subunit [Tranquillimonas alkanivorans]